MHFINFAWYRQARINHTIVCHAFRSPRLTHAHIDHEYTQPFSATLLEAPINQLWVHYEWSPLIHWFHPNIEYSYVKAKNKTRFLSVITHFSVILITQMVKKVLKSSKLRRRTSQIKHFFVKVNIINEFSWWFNII